MVERDDELSSAVIDAIEEIQQLESEAAKNGGKRSGDILVFLSGERDIRELALAIRRAEFKHFEVLPLYARLSLAEQNKVFQSSGRSRRIVLATNVAETSITVPGIRYVIDPGTARINRYSYRTQVQRLPVENISQASANQRKVAVVESVRGCVFASTARMILFHAPSLPMLKFCVPIWRRCYKC